MLGPGVFRAQKAPLCRGDNSQVCGVLPYGIWSCLHSPFTNILNDSGTLPCNNQSHWLYTLARQRPLPAAQGRHPQRLRSCYGPGFYWAGARLVRNKTDSGPSDRCPGSRNSGKIHGCRHRRATSTPYKTTGWLTAGLSDTPTGQRKEKEQRKTGQTLSALGHWKLTCFVQAGV